MLGVSCNLCGETNSSKRDGVECTKVYSVLKASPSLPYDSRLLFSFSKMFKRNAFSCKQLKSFKFTEK